MKNDTFLKNIFSILIIGFLTLSLISCGSSQSAYNNDGIYATEQNREVVIVKDTKSDYYKNYFEAEGERYDIDENEIFTDIDEYGYEDSDTIYVSSEYSQAAPWNYATEVSVSFYMGFGGFFGYYNPWNYGYGYRHYGYGYGGYGYGGYGYGGYYPWYGYGGGYWGGYCPPYYSGYYPTHYPGYYPPYNGYYSYGKRDTYSTNRYSRSRINTRNVATSEPYDYKRGYSSSNRRATTKNYSQRSNTNNSYTGRYNSKTRSSLRNSKTIGTKNYNRSSNTRNNSSSYRTGSGAVRRSTGRQQEFVNSGRRTGNYVSNSSTRSNNPVKIARTNQKRVSYTNARNTSKSTTYKRTQSNSSNYYSRSSGNQHQRRASSTSSNNNYSRSSSPSRSSSVSRSSSPSSSRSSNSSSSRSSVSRSRR